MALPSAAAPVQSGHERPATDGAESVPATVVPAQGSLHKQPIAANPQNAVLDRPPAAQLQPVSQCASQPIAAPANLAEPHQLQTSAAAPPQTDAAAPAEAQTAAQPEAPTVVAVPNMLDVVCADVQGVLTLDFKGMRCFILYKGRPPPHPQPVISLCRKAADH